MKSGVPDFRAVFRLRSLIRSFRPDVVHCHMFHANILGRITRLFCRMPALICTAHSIKETSILGGPTWHKELLYRATDSLADQTTIICNAGFDRYVRVGAVPRKKLRMNSESIPSALRVLRRRSSEREKTLVSTPFGIDCDHTAKHMELPEGACVPIHDGGKPRILYIITRARRGGAQTHVLSLACAMRQDFEVAVATGEEGFLTEACRERSIPVYILPHLQRQIRPIADARAFWEILKLIQRLQPDLIHAHTFKAGFLGRLAPIGPS